MGIGTRQVLGMSMCRLVPAIFWLQVFWSLTRSSGALSVYHTSRPLQHLAVDEDTGRVYVGGTNALYQLDGDLNEQVHISTNLEKPYNISKVLVVDSQNGHLITCGSSQRGTCQVRQLQNISSAKSYDCAKCNAAANDDHRSTVAFVGPGPFNNEVLYVGATLTGPAVCSRNLTGSGIMQISKYNFIEPHGTYIYLKADISYIVKYVAGFSLNGYSYFLTVQKETIKADDEKYISKIVQICQQDQFYYSYVEIPMVCNQSNVVYNRVVAATLVTPGSDLAGQLGITTNDPLIIAVFRTDLHSRGSAICAYPVHKIRQTVTENIRKCHKGDGHLGRHLKDKGCQQTSMNISDTYCGSSANTPLAGTIPVIAQPMIVWNETGMTSIAVDRVHSHTVAFLGTTDGHLKKVVLGNVHFAREYHDEDISGGKAILQDMKFTKDHRHIYLMADTNVYKKPVQTCSKQKSCSECSKLQDPYCGWCSLKRKCSERKSCSNDYRRWLAYDRRCIKITNVSPDKVHVKTTGEVTITIEELPDLKGNERYQCVFARDVIKEAQVTQTGLKCQLPSGKEQTHIKDGEDHVVINLGIRSTATNVSFLNRDFIFYNCSVHTSCSKCAMTRWPCWWCVHNNKCTNDNATCSRDSTFVSEKAACPYLLEAADKILVPVGIEREFHVFGRNLPEPNRNQDGYECLIHLKNPPLKIAARRLNSTTVQCINTLYSYDELLGSKTESVEIRWNGRFLIDDDFGLRATFYKCDLLGSDCSTCMHMQSADYPIPYGCKYCNNRCTYGTICVHNTIQQTCPEPEILGVSPSSSPIQGGTNVTITGTNLGSSYAQIKDSVKLAGYTCTVIKELYMVSKQIVCTSTGPGRVLTGDVSITIGDSTVVWKSFLYREPSVESISPQKGPKAGGTTVTIMGRKLKTGKHITVFLKDAPCTVLSVEDERLLCRTPEMKQPITTSRVIVTFDSNARQTLAATFQFTENPNITSVEPKKSFESGGREITVKGVNLNSVQDPRLFIVQGGNRSNATSCFVIDDKKMLCPSPRAPRPVQRRRSRRSGNAAKAENYQLGFLMDGVQSVRNVSAFHVYPDPFYYKFKDQPEKNHNGRRIYGGDVLSLSGLDLNLACTTNEVKVLIGDKPCKVKTLSRENLFCAPSEQPNAQAKDTYPVVKVFVGANGPNFTLGELEYQKNEKQPVEIWALGIGIGGGILITIIIIILIIYRRKSTDAERQYKKMQIQLDTLESNVRNECKQAFAELQTEVSDFTSDLNIVGIPFWDYKVYSFKVLFPGLRDHQVLHGTNNDTLTKFGSYDEGLQQFNQLLNNKQFILIFIRTLELQRNFSMRDKAVVASLLMIVLQDKMEYATEVLKALLNELIDRSVEKKHPKLMLRRTESVVEKLLSNWLSLCMYDYIKKHAGKALFMLYKAIKHQTEKGPVDAIVSEGRYSLSEDRLLREKIDSQTLTINVITDDGREPVPCKVLDCDTITQAKQKALDAIYMNSPFSRRPSVWDVDLEWRSGRSGHLPLQDEDVTTTTTNGWKKVNVLAHYHLPDGALMALVPKKNKNDMVRKIHGMLEITGSSTSTLSPIVTMEEAGTKVWHLVKHDDNQNISREKKVISEIFLTRLLATKGTLQQYVDDLFMTILRVDNTLPPSVKYLFDFLDNAARRHNIVDPDVVHTWKSNSLPLRFWVNIVKNPEFAFDIHKSHIVDSCLSVIAQTFMDSCSTQEHRLGKDSPSNKLLFAKDISKYRNWVSKFYKGVEEMPPVTDRDITRVMTEHSMTHIVDFNVSVALRELYKYGMQYSFELLEALDDDPSAKKLHLANKFEQASAAIEGNPLY